eukprot:14482806-Alexandrium_andersonii.AAC.1
MRVTSSSPKWHRSLANAVPGHGSPHGPHEAVVQTGCGGGPNGPRRQGHWSAKRRKRRPNRSNRQPGRPARRQP